MKREGGRGREEGGGGREEGGREEEGRLEEGEGGRREGGRREGGGKEEGRREGGRREGWRKRVGGGGGREEGGGGSRGREIGMEKRGRGGERKGEETKLCTREGTVVVDGQWKHSIDYHRQPPSKHTPPRHTQRSAVLGSVHLLLA